MDIHKVDQCEAEEESDCGRSMELYLLNVWKLVKDYAWKIVHDVKCQQVA